MKHEHRSPEGHSQVTEQVFTDRIAVIDLPPEMWDDNAEQKFVNVRGDEELLKRLDERLKHAVTLVRPAAPWRDGSYESWEAAYKTRVPSSLYASWFPVREEQRRLYWALMDRRVGLRSCRSADIYYVEVDLARLGAAFAQSADPVEG